MILVRTVKVSKLLFLNPWVFKVLKRRLSEDLMGSGSVRAERVMGSRKLVKGAHTSRTGIRLQALESHWKYPDSLSPPRAFWKLKKGRRIVRTFDSLPDATTRPVRPSGRQEVRPMTLQGG